MKRRISGQAATEYLVLLALVGLALAVGPDSPLEQLVRGLQARHAAYSFALSLP